MGYEAVLTYFPVGSRWRSTVVTPGDRVLHLDHDVIVLGPLHRLCGELPEVKSGSYSLRFENVDGVVVTAALAGWPGMPRGTYQPGRGDPWGKECRYSIAS